MSRTSIPLAVPGVAAPVSAIFDQPADPKSVLVFAHGAGAGMRHAFMEAVVERLGARRVATFRYQFPYWEQGRRRPDPQPVLLETVRAAVAAAQARAPELPLFAGGKSMGGRMTTLAAAEEPLESVRGIVLFGFPLHRPGPPSTTRATHLAAVKVPMLFLQGTRDTLADLESMRGVCEGLGANATLHVEEGADHSFHVLKRSGRSDAEMLDALTKVAVRWMEERRAPKG